MSKTHNFKLSSYQLNVKKNSLGLVCHFNIVYIVSLFGISQIENWIT